MQQPGRTQTNRGESPNTALKLGKLGHVSFAFWFPTKNPTKEGVPKKNLRTQMELPIGTAHTRRRRIDIAQALTFDTGIACSLLCMAWIFRSSSTS